MRINWAVSCVDAKDPERFGYPVPSVTDLGVDTFPSPPVGGKVPLGVIVGVTVESFDVAGPHRLGAQLARESGSAGELQEPEPIGEPLTDTFLVEAPPDHPHVRYPPCWPHVLRLGLVVVPSPGLYTVNLSLDDSADVYTLPFFIV